MASLRTHDAPPSPSNTFKVFGDAKTAQPPRVQKRKLRDEIEGDDAEPLRHRGIPIKLDFSTSSDEAFIHAPPREFVDLSGDDASDAPTGTPREFVDLVEDDASDASNTSDAGTRLLSTKRVTRTVKTMMHFLADSFVAVMHGDRDLPALLAECPTTMNYFEENFYPDHGLLRVLDAPWTDAEQVALINAFVYLEASSNVSLKAVFEFHNKDCVQWQAYVDANFPGEFGESHRRLFYQLLFDRSVRFKGLLA